jgi:hypothetical protein
MSSLISHLHDWLRQRLGAVAPYFLGKPTDFKVPHSALFACRPMLDLTAGLLWTVSESTLTKLRAQEPPNEWSFVMTKVRFTRISW